MSAQDAARWHVVRVEVDGAGLRLRGNYSGRMTRAEADAYAQRLAESLQATVRAELDDDPARIFTAAS